MKKIKYPSWDIQYFKNWILIKSELSEWIIIDYSTTPKTVTLKR